MFRDAGHETVLDETTPQMTFAEWSAAAAAERRAERLRQEMAAYYRSWNARYAAAMINSPMHGRHRR